MATFANLAFAETISCPLLNRRLSGKRFFCKGAGGGREDFPGLYIVVLMLLPICVPEKTGARPIAHTLGSHPMAISTMTMMTAKMGILVWYAGDWRCRSDSPRAALGVTTYAQDDPNPNDTIEQAGRGDPRYRLRDLAKRHMPHQLPLGGGGGGCGATLVSRPRPGMRAGTLEMS